MIMPMGSVEGLLDDGNVLGTVVGETVTWVAMPLGLIYVNSSRVRPSDWKAD